MEKIPTALEVWYSRNPTHDTDLDTGEDKFYKTIQMCMIEFAKLHVKAALETASLNGEVGYDGVTPEIDKESILSAYPLTNIK